VVLEIDSAAPQSVYVGGVGPAPAAEVEAEREASELSFRARAFALLEPRWDDSVAHIYENPGALGEAFFAGTVATAAGRDGVVDCLRAHAGEAVACLERDQKPADFPAGSGNVEVFARHADRLVLRTDAAAPATLVISRLFAPGWRASVDGEPTPIARANEALMALRVPAGAHEVALEYAPRSVRIGLVVTIVSLLLWLTLLVVPSRRV
jgi:hypothetical protein